MKQVAVRRVQIAQANRAPRDGNKIRPHPFAITGQILMRVQRLRTYNRPRAHILPTPYGPGPSVRCTSSRGGRSAAISVSRRCHKSPRLQWAAVDVPGQFVARHAVLRAPVDTCKRPESTSQAEYAGSIPVIGSTNPQVSDAAPGPHHGARRCGRVAWRCGHRVGGGVRLDGFVAVVPEMPP